MDNINERVNYWLELANYDLDTAKVMLSGKRYLYVGFMCHQVAEKSLKAYYASTNEDTPPYIHNLLRLAELTETWELLSETQKQVLLSLNPLNIEARYPIQKQRIESVLTPEYCTVLIKNTEDFLLWIESRLSN